MNGYKAFNKDMTCNGMQYKEGETYEMKESPKCCDNGFHFCENPLDTLNYYDLCDSEFAEVEALGDIDKGKDDDTKMATNKIKIGAKLGISGLVKASVDFLWESCKKKDKKNKENQSTSKKDSQLASSGDYSQLASSGDYSQLASSGYNSQLASSGDNSKLASSGYNSKLASSGDNSKLASSGDYSKLASSGYNSQLASSGDYSQLASSGKYSKVSHNEGIENVVCNVGIEGIAKGKKGDILVLAEYKEIYLDDGRWVHKPVCVKTKKIDGKILKEDTFYKLENKKFVEAED